MEGGKMTSGQGITVGIWLDRGFKMLLGGLACLIWWLVR